ncbi:MAG: JDVT-CTERM domain-containing protein, partial [Burkholderiales bacterium]
GQAKLTMSPTSLRLTSGGSGEPPAPGKAVLKNTGTTNISVTALRVKAGRFTVAQACGSLPLSLAPGQTCELEVALAAGVPAGDVEDVLVVTTDADGIAPTLKIETDAPEMPAANAPVSQIPGSGGCSLVNPQAGLFDPMLWLLCGLAGAVLWSRRARPPSAAAQEMLFMNHKETNQ